MPTVSPEHELGNREWQLTDVLCLGTFDESGPSGVPTAVPPQQSHEDCANGALPDFFVRLCGKSS